MKKFFTDNWIVLIIGVALAASTLLAFHNNNIIQQNIAQQKETVLVTQRTQQILSSVMHGLDLGVRGFALTKDENMLRPFNEAVTTSPGIFAQLDSLLKKQEYADAGKLDEVKKEVDNYIAFSKQMVETARIDSMRTFVAMLSEDRGYGVWKKYDEISKPLLAFEDELNQKAISNYNAAMRSNLGLQISIVILALPILVLFVKRVRKEREARHALLLEVEENNRNYVFNSGEKDDSSAQAINDASIRNVRMASEFIKSMTNGNYDVNWDGLNEKNSDLNANTLAGNLLQMREQLKKLKQEDDKRNWMNEGLASFSELVRNNQHDNTLLADKCVSYLVKYLNAQQGSLFVLEGEEGETYLELKACFAFDKKKWMEKRVDIGNGLVGQAFLEGDTIQLKDIPLGYTTITSGLGDATPRHLVIVPLKYDITTVAILEMASFGDFEEHHILFLKKAGEFLASAILNSQTTFKMKNLLEQAHINEEQMRQREEEMRQNMEELQATQEELVRKEREMQKRMAGEVSSK
ncbi:sensor domain CHASE3-containing protein [Chryseolinea serpens]|uniref:Sensor domain CHASE3-containing protein n=1 Tax=Chryseolinea serpens TaxID=947013 RepID=A0A1M5WHS3_9BACT|nr:CHASE3 domain-containing protein [Chryseolinea serpens]SHH87056.1 sensor domain CHASE3-containing protein [Chryseolinea serpens]